MTKYSPIDDFSQALLSSIPKKIKFMLSQAGLNIDAETDLDSISFPAFNNSGGVITFKTLDVSIFWDGNDETPSGVWTTKEEFSNIKDNLDTFVLFEQEIYLEIEKLTQDEHTEN